MQHVDAVQRPASHQGQISSSAFRADCQSADRPERVLPPAAHIAQSRSTFTSNRQQKVTQTSTTAHGLAALPSNLWAKAAISSSRELPAKPQHVAPRRVSSSPTFPSLRPQQTPLAHPLRHPTDCCGLLLCSEFPSLAKLTTTALTVLIWTQQQVRTNRYAEASFSRLGPCAALC